MLPSLSRASLLSMLLGLLCVSALLFTLLGSSCLLLRGLISLLVRLRGLSWLVQRLVGRIGQQQPSAQTTCDGGSQRIFRSLLDRAGQSIVTHLWDCEAWL